VFRPKPVGDHPAAWVEVVSRAALSNLIGSMGYFVGESLVRLPPGVAPAPDRVKASAFDQGSGTWVTPNWRAALYTATPSRSFFPRGFLWDEGFHQLLVQKWDPRISRDALAHWLDLMNSEGWIPREQILGEEARARVPAEFVVQHPDHANPPSLMLPLALMARAAAAGAASGAAEGAGEGAGDAAGSAKAAAETEAARQWLERAWPRLEVWYSWFNRTQAGQLPGSYRWVEGS
jgi:mannosyl-oligosaccharide glucosidase